MADVSASRRKGIVRTYAFESEALEILASMCPNRMAFGKFLSDLLRAEEARRHELRLIRQRPTAMAAEVERACG
jgi:hypothetical protein